MNHLKTQWQNQIWLTPVPSRKTVDDMLWANGIRKAVPVNKNGYHEPVKKYFPHVQSVMDGKQVNVHINENCYSFIMEYSKDIATDAICSSGIAKTETGTLVEKTFHEHVHNYQRPLSTLVDNCSANKKAAIDLGAEGTLFINAFPYRPETKGALEGEFGLFERTVSHLYIRGKTEQEKAASIVENVAKMYALIRNKTPRCSVCPFTPVKLIKANLDDKDANQAFIALTKEQEKKKIDQEKRLQISKEKQMLLESIIKEHRLCGNILYFKKYLRHVEISTIKQAEQTFSVYSHKDIFDESKRTLAYFAAIAKNMQQAKDQQQKEKIAQRRYSLDQAAQHQRRIIAEELALKNEKRQLEKEPHLITVKAIQAQMALPVNFRKTIKVNLKIIDKALKAIVSKSKQSQITMTRKIEYDVMNITSLSLTERYEWINYVSEQIKILTNDKAKTVTPL